MTPFHQEQKRYTSQRDLSAIPPFILLCFLREGKLETRTSAAQVKEQGRREKKSFISCTSGLELHLELITPPSSSEPLLTATQPRLPIGRYSTLNFAGNTQKGRGEGLEVSANGQASSVSRKGNPRVVT